MGRNEQMPLSARTQTNLWVISPVDERVEPLARALRIAPLVAQVLLNRGHHRGRSGQRLPATQADRADPALPRCRGSSRPPPACATAIEKKEKITVYGDYDVDGITGVSILWELLTLLGAQVDYYIPHRIEEGYGLNSEAVRSLAEAGTRLLITVDCGIAAFEAADVARQARRRSDRHRPSPAW